MKLTKRVVVLTAAEAEFGVDPGDPYTGILTKIGSEIKSGGDPVMRETLRDTLSPRGHVIGVKQQELALPLELRGAGNVGDALNTPEIETMLLACSMAREEGLVCVMDSAEAFEIGETITNNTQNNAAGIVADIDGTNLFIRLENAPTDGDVLTGDNSTATATINASSQAIIYRPDSPDIDDMGSNVFHYYIDGIRHIVTGARGSFDIEMTVGQIPAINFSFSGNYADPTDTDNPTDVSYLQLIPRPVVGASLKIGTVDLSDVAVSSLAFGIANDIQSRDDIKADDGRLGYVIQAREPTGSIDPEAKTLAEFNPYADWKDGTLVPIAAGIGNAFGNRIRVVMPTTQFTEIPYGERNGVLTYELGFRATGDDDEMMLIYW